MHKILLVGQDDILNPNIEDYLIANTIQVYIAKTVKEGFSKLLQHNPDVLVIEHSENCNALEFLTLLSEHKIKLPRLIISQPKDVDLRIEAVEAYDAEYYMLKPFYPIELVVQCKAILNRHTKPKAKNKITYPFFELDFEEKSLQINGQIVDLTPRQLDLLGVLASEPNKNFTRESLLDKVWHGEGKSIRLIDSTINLIRSELKRHTTGIEPWELKAVYGTGYRFQYSGA